MNDKLESNLILEAADVLEAVRDSGVALPENWRWPLIDELRGVEILESSIAEQFNQLKARVAVIESKLNPYRGGGVGTTLLPVNSHPEYREPTLEDAWNLSRLEFTTGSSLQDAILRALKQLNFVRKVQP